MGDRTAFFYGTLMAPEILHRVLYGTTNLSTANHATRAAAAKLTITPAILHDYCRHRVLLADYPGMVPQPGARVRGMFVAGLTGENVKSLDWFEGSQYERVKVRIVLLEDGVEGEVSEAETYVFTAGDQELEKKEWDYEVFRRERLENWADTSKEYDEVDANASAEAEGRDPTAGQGIYGNLLEELEKEAEEEKLQSAV